MDRLTLTGAEGVKAFCSLCADKPSFGKCEIAKECYSRQVYLALRAYEDTGLTPGNITYQTASLQEWQRKCALMPIDNAQLRAELEQAQEEIKRLRENKDVIEAFEDSKECYIERLQNELGHLRSHLLWALQMLQEGYTVSDHICGFTHAPDTGHCEFCDKYGKAISVLGLEGR